MNLLEIGKSKIKGSDGTYKYMYKCSCGSTFLTYKRSVRLGKTKSCGCLKGYFISKNNHRKTPPNALLDPSESSFNALFGSYKSSAKLKDLDFNLSKSFFKLRTKLNCYYCGRAPFKKYMRTKWAREPYIYNGLDRVDNNKGYIESNIVACCADCNYLKGSRGHDDFISHTLRIARWIGKLK